MAKAGKGIRAIILAPTRELAHQIYNECLKLARGRKWRIILFSKATAATIADKSVQNKVGMFLLTSVPCLGNCADATRLDVVVSTPLRLVSSFRSGNLSFDKYVYMSRYAIFVSNDSLNSVRHLILDEADRMLDQEFISQVQEIIAACTHESIQKAVFSATLPAGVERVALDMLRDPIRVVVGLKCVPHSSQSRLDSYHLDFRQRHASAPYRAVPYLRSR